MSKEDLREGGDSGKEQEAGELSEEALEGAQGGRKESQATAPQKDSNKALFRTLEQDMLFKRIERKGWHR